MEEINLKLLLKYFIKKMPIIILITILFSLVGFFTTENKQSIIHNNITTIIIDYKTSPIDINKNNYEIDLKKIYETLLKSDYTLDEVIEKLNLNYSTTELRDCFYVNLLGEDDFRLSIEFKNEPKANLIIQEIKNIFNRELTKLYDVNTINFYDSEAVEIEENSVIKEVVKLTMIGFILSSTIVFLIYYFDFTIKTISDLKNIELPIIGKITKDSKKKNTEFNNSINILRLNIEEKIKKEKNKSIFITSSIKGEGKTYVTKNLAKSFSNAGYKTLVINMSNKGTKDSIKELSNIDVKKHITVTNDLSFLNYDINNIDINKIEYQEKFKKVLKSLEKDYDLILVDGLSIKETSDVIIYSNIIDKILIMCCKDKTLISNLKSTIRFFSREKLLGLVVNKMDSYL